jgi:hypothetical protein
MAADSQVSDLIIHKATIALEQKICESAAKNNCGKKIKQTI